MSHSLEVGRESLLVDTATRSLIDSYYRKVQTGGASGTETLEFYRNLDSAYRNQLRLADDPLMTVPQLANNLYTINRLLGDEHATKCFSSVSIHDSQFHYQLASIAPSLDIARTSYFKRIAGPATKIEILPERKSKHGSKGWLSDSTFSEHCFDESGAVIYRGLSLIIGDVLCSETSVSSGGIFSSVYNPCFRFTHVAIFTILESAGLRFPAVIEIHEHGVRAVPLSRFLSSAYTLFCEQYRPTSIVDKSRLNSAAATLLEMDTHFDFIGDSPIGSGFTCASLVSFLLCKGGVNMSTVPRFGYTMEARKIMSSLGQKYFEPQVVPDSFSDPSNFSLVGHCINAYSPAKHELRNFARHFGIMFRSSTLNPSLPLVYSVLLSFAKIADRNFGMRWMTLKLFGFKRSTLFPNAPVGLLCLIFLLEVQFEKVVKSIENDGPCSPLYKKAVASIDSLFRNGANQA